MRPSLDELHNPAYTGRNRCWPCTITNAVLLAIVVAVAALRGRRIAATAIAVVGTAAIALRGYIVPYTPQFAPRLVAAFPIDSSLFDHGESATEPGSLVDSGTETGEDGPTGEAVLTELLEAGVVVPEAEDIRLADAFRADWYREMRSLRDVDLETLASIANEQTQPSIDARAARSWGRPTLVLEGGGTSVTLSRGVAVAELAAVRALESRVDDVAIRRAGSRPLRSLLDACPLCDDDLTITRSTCCGETTPIGKRPSEKLVCTACDERFFVFADADS